MSTASALIVTQKNVRTFYKDEGGKSNFLTATIALPPSYTGAPLPLKTSLYFESGCRVEERDQSILAMLDYKFNQPVVAPGRPVTLRYRLEKVSRRKDNQRFKMFVEVDYDHDAVPVGAERIKGVYTCPVAVLSKRKTGERFVVRRNPSPQQRMKEFTAKLESIVGGLSNKVDALCDAVAANTLAVADQNQRLARIEACLGGASAAICNNNNNTSNRSLLGNLGSSGRSLISIGSNDGDDDGDDDNAAMTFFTTFMDSGDMNVTPAGVVTAAGAGGDGAAGATNGLTAGDLALDNGGATTTFVPPALVKSISRELIERAVKASWAMSAGTAGDLNIDGLLGNPSLKRSRAAAAMGSPAGGSESGSDSPGHVAATTSRPAMPRVVLTTGKVNGRTKSGVPRVRKWRSMEICFEPSQLQQQQQARPCKQRRTMNKSMA